MKRRRLALTPPFYCRPRRFGKSLFPDTESIFHIITLLTFKNVGIDLFAEVHSSQGRADVIVKTKRFIYALELKLDASAREALDQIVEKGYLQPYSGDERKKPAIGIAFSSEQRNIAEYRVKES